MRWVVPVLLATGCSNLLGISELSGPDAIDAATDGSVVFRTLSGTVKPAVQSGGLSGASVAAIAADATVLAQTTSGADGTYALRIPTDGLPFDAELRVSDPSTPSTYSVHHAFYGPFTGDRDKLDIAIITRTELGQLRTTLGLPNLDGTAQILVEIRNAADVPLAGFTVDAPFAIPRIYYSTNGIPTTASSTTTTDGRAFLFACKLGNVKVIADGPAGATRDLYLAKDDIYEVIMRIP